jgi:hypothetical protein
MILGSTAPNHLPQLHQTAWLKSNLNEFHTLSWLKSMLLDFKMVSAADWL